MQERQSLKVHSLSKAEKVLYQGEGDAIITAGMLHQEKADLSLCLPFPGDFREEGRI